jgi:uncharacterized membrane protein YgcG
VQSDAYVTFVGTGSDFSLIYFLILVLLIALLILALVACCTAFMRYFFLKGERRSIQSHVVTLREDSGGSIQRGSLDSERYSLRGPSRGGSGSRASAGSRRR